MTDERKLRLKWTLKAHGKQVVFIKKSQESQEHVLMKAYLWALYLPLYPDLLVEYSIGQRYKPDVIALDAEQKPLFWGEAGQVGLEKMTRIFTKYKTTHFALAKWNMRLDPLAQLIEKALKGVKRTAPIDLIEFKDNADFIDEKGVIQVSHADLTWRQL